MGAAQQISVDFSFFIEKTPIYNDELQNYSKYSKFKDVDEYDNHWSMFLTDYKHHFTKHQLDALFIVRQNGCKYPGVSYKRYSKLEKDALAYFGYEIKRDTFRTALDKAEKLGALFKFDGIRMIKGRGSRTANVVVFNRYEEIKSYQIAQLEKEQKEVEKLLEEEHARTAHIINYHVNAAKWAAEKAEKQAREAAEAERKEKARKEAAEKIIKSAKEAEKYEKLTEYQQLEVLLSGRYDKKVIRRVYGIWVAKTKKLAAAVTFGVAVQAIKALIKVEETRKENNVEPLSNPPGYFAGIVDNKLKDFAEKEMEKVMDELENQKIETEFFADTADYLPEVTPSFEIYNWLEEEAENNPKEIQIYNWLERT